MQTRLPTLDKERSVRLWEEWGRSPKKFLEPKKYEQSVARKEPPAAPAVAVVKATRKKTISRKR